MQREESAGEMCCEQCGAPISEDTIYRRRWGARVRQSEGTGRAEKELTKRKETKIPHEFVYLGLLGLITLIFVAMPFLSVTLTRGSNSTGTGITGFDLVRLSWIRLTTPVGSMGFSITFPIVWLIVAAGIILMAFGLLSLLLAVSGRKTVSESLSERAAPLVVSSGVLLTLVSAVTLIHFLIVSSGWSRLWPAGTNTSMFLGWGLIAETVVAVLVVIAGWRILKSAPKMSGTRMPRTSIISGVAGIIAIGLLFAPFLTQRFSSPLFNVTYDGIILTENIFWLSGALGFLAGVWLIVFGAVVAIFAATFLALGRASAPHDKSSAPKQPIRSIGERVTIWSQVLSISGAMMLVGATVTLIQTLVAPGDVPFGLTVGSYIPGFGVFCEIILGAVILVQGLWMWRDAKK